MRPSDWHIYCAKLPHQTITYSSVATIVPTVVGALGMEESKRESLRAEGCVFDDEGNSISSYNPWFCELTSVHWLLNNQRHDYVGNAHYRRKWSDAGIENSTRGPLYVPTALQLPVTMRQQFRESHPHFDAPSLTISLAEQGHLPFTPAEMTAIWEQRHLHCFQMARGPWPEYRQFMRLLFDCLWPIWDEYHNYLEATRAVNLRMMGFVGERMMTGLILCRDRFFDFPIVTSDVELVQ